jgi:hypothetical protein
MSFFMSYTPAPSAPSFTTPSGMNYMQFCRSCGDELEFAARFCGNCGCVAEDGSEPSADIQLVEAPLPDLPDFAQVSPPQSGQISSELQKEADRIMILLARERFFLVLHWSCFIGLNLLGAWLALKCYVEFIGDDVSKLLMACTPLLFINSLALMFLVPLRGTKKQLARLKEQLSYIKFQVEFQQLF